MRVFRLGHQPQPDVFGFLHRAGYGRILLSCKPCYISQSAISQQIQSLEKEIGVKLFERKNRKFTLTSAGEHFYNKTVVLSSELERI